MLFYVFWQQKESLKGEGDAAEVSCKEDEPCSGTKKEMSYRAVKEVHHRLPGFHEDYFGPRNHKSKHHWKFSWTNTQQNFLLSPLSHSLSFPNFVSDGSLVPYFHREMDLRRFNILPLYATKEFPLLN